MAQGDYKLGLTEAKAGVPFPAGPLEVVRQELPAPLLRNLTLASRVVKLGELLDAAVFDECVPGDRLVELAVTRAQDLAAQPAFTEVKGQVRGALQRQLADLAD